MRMEENLGKIWKEARRKKVHSSTTLLDLI
jgi:hypothetical protein